jgi:hypothetical protein
VARRRLTIKRLDPWSVLKFGALANVVLLAIFMLVAGVVWFIIDRLQLVDQACGIAADVGFTSCGINAGNLFRALLLLGLLWVVVQTAVLVFAAFLHNLIADLTGGLVIGVVDDSTPSRQDNGRRAATTPTPTPSARIPDGPGARYSVPRTGSAPTDAATRAQQPVGDARPRPRGRASGDSEDLFNRD